MYARLWTALARELRRMEVDIGANGQRGKKHRRVDVEGQTKMQRIEDNPPNPIRPITGANYQAHPLLPPISSDAYIIPGYYITNYPVHVYLLYASSTVCVSSCIPRPTYLTPAFPHFSNTHQSHLFLDRLYQPVLQFHLSQLTADVFANIVKAARHIDKCEYGRMNGTRITSVT